MPFIEYAVNKEYIVKNLCINRDKPKSCCQGKCHLNKELSKSDTTTENEGNENNKKPQQNQISEFVTTEINRIQVYELVLNDRVVCEPTLETRLGSSIFVPPKDKFKI